MNPEIDTPSSLAAFFVGKMVFNRFDVTNSSSPRLPMRPATVRLREINSKLANLTLSAVTVRPRVPLSSQCRQTLCDHQRLQAPAASA